MGQAATSTFILSRSSNEETGGWDEYWRTAWLTSVAGGRRKRLPHMPGKRTAPRQRRVKTRVLTQSVSRMTDGDRCYRLCLPKSIKKT
jgi:hypothetical protein